MKDVDIKHVMQNENKDVNLKVSPAEEDRDRETELVSIRPRLNLLALVGTERVKRR